MYILNNQDLKLTINPLGAELTSLVYANREYIYQKDQSYWNRCSPVLFPIVGRLKNNQYEYNNQLYELSQHGFLRDRLFKLNYQTDHKISFIYHSNSQDYQIFPFKFSFELIYTLNGPKVTISYLITNNDLKNLPFNLGAHPAFSVSNSLNAKFCFEKQIVNRLLLANGFISQSVETKLDTIKFTPEQIKQDAIILTNFTNPVINLYDLDQFILQMNFANFPDLGLWTPDPDAKFVCIEPWNGHTDFETTSSHSNFLAKRNLIQLAPNTSKQFELTINLKI